jgi:hypothetical protein
MTAKNELIYEDRRQAVMPPSMNIRLVLGLPLRQIMAISSGAARHA